MAGSLGKAFTRRPAWLFERFGSERYWYSVLFGLRGALRALAAVIFNSPLAVVSVTAVVTTVDDAERVGDSVAAAPIVAGAAAAVATAPRMPRAPKGSMPEGSMQLVALPVQMGHGLSGKSAAEHAHADEIQTKSSRIGCVTESSSPLWNPVQ